MRIDESINRTYAQMSSGRRINSAADDAAGLAVSESMKGEIKAYNKGTENAQSMNDLSKTADSALSSIGDSLQRIKELAVQASNGTYSAADKQMAQKEISQLKEGIKSAATNTEFNGIKVLDGTFTDKNIASNPYGTGKTMSIQNTSLETLGIDNLDVTGSFDMASIDNAISKVSESRGNVGATSNGIDSTIRSNEITSENLSSSESRLGDADMEKMVMQLKTQQMQQQAQIFSQRRQMEGKASSLNLLG